MLRLLEHGEEYVFTLPSAYARSILTLPWVDNKGANVDAKDRWGRTALHRGVSRSILS